MFLWHFPSAYAARGLPGTLPYGVRTFLDRGFPASRPPGPLNEESVAQTEYCWAYGPHDIVSHMKTTIEVSEALMDEAKRFAAKRGMTLRALIEASLRRELDSDEAPFELEDLSVDGAGMAPEFVEGGWPSVRDEIYRGRGT